MFASAATKSCARDFDCPRRRAASRFLLCSPAVLDMTSISISPPPSSPGRGGGDLWPIPSFEPIATFPALANRPTSGISRLRSCNRSERPLVKGGQAMAFDRSTIHVYAGAEPGGLFRKAIDDAHWQSLTRGLPQPT